MDYALLQKISNRALYYSTQMIYLANHRKDKMKGDPKIGGHTAACASYLHIASALHLCTRHGFDYMAVKPHAAPMDHCMNYMLDLFLEPDNTRFTEEKAKIALHGLRKFSQNGEPVFQSYHSAYDCDHHNFLPSGTVGIPPVQLGYLAHAYRLCEANSYNVPKNAHFWAVMGDAEYREGSLQEALPDFAERELGNLTWIVDYNRQSLDGNRITNREIVGGSDCERIAKTAQASGWEVIQVRHGQKRLKVFAMKGGAELQDYFENQLEDYKFQNLLLVKDIKVLREQMLSEQNKLKTILDQVSDSELVEVMRDLGGHDIQALHEAMLASKKDSRRPTLIIAHTIKGWGLQQAATAGNHSALPEGSEVDIIREKHGIPADDIFKKFDNSSPEAKFLKQRGEELYKQMMEQYKIRDANKEYFTKWANELGTPGDSLDINFKMASYPHTQWMLGQLTAKLNRIANTSLNEKELKERQKALSESEKAWKLGAEMLVAMAPDVGTSTNLNPTMDGQIFDPEVVENFEEQYSTRDPSLPLLVPSEDKQHKFIRFEIEESNSMSCVGSYGQIRDRLGIPLLPLMTVYDFFVKRALDQHFYNLYWKSSFILVGTPSGVTLSPEGAQHGWKSDWQIPNQITWEPFYVQELDWIMADAIKRHLSYDNHGRQGVNIRAVTRGAEQKDFLARLKRHKKFKDAQYEGHILHHDQYAMANATAESSIPCIDDASIWESTRQSVLKGAYYLIDYRGYAGYEPGDNVVNIFSMGSLTTEAIVASDKLLERGIYANVIVVTSTDLLLGVQGHESDYQYLKQELGIETGMYLSTNKLEFSDSIGLAGKRVPVVSVHDGEPGLLDNIGSILGVKQECLAVRKHSKCGRPVEVYAYHHIDADSLVEASGKALAETALENLQLSPSLLAQIAGQSPSAASNWRELWPST